MPPKKTVSMRHASRVPDEIDIRVGGRVRLRRVMLDMSQAKLAGLIGISFQQIQKYERGINRISSGRLQDFASALETPVEWFFDQGPVSAPAYLVEFLVTPEGFQLNRAFPRIKDKNLRRRIIGFIEAAAAQESGRGA